MRFYFYIVIVVVLHLYYFPLSISNKTFYKKHYGGLLNRNVNTRNISYTSCIICLFSKPLYCKLDMPQSDVSRTGKESTLRRKVKLAKYTAYSAVHCRSFLRSVRRFLTGQCETTGLINFHSTGNVPWKLLTGQAGYFDTILVKRCHFYYRNSLTRAVIGCSHFY